MVVMDGVIVFLWVFDVVFIVVFKLVVVNVDDVVDVFVVNNYK